MFEENDMKSKICLLLCTLIPIIYYNSKLFEATLAALQPQFDQHRLKPAIVI